MSMHIAKPEHEVAYQDLAKLLQKHIANVSALELLAIASNLVGKLVAMQDQRVISPKSAMELVAKNIEAGNEHAVRELRDSIAGRA